MRMDIPADLARFIEGQVLMTLATRDAGNRPMIARGSGGRIAGGQLEVAISAHLWPETVANLRDNGMLAATFVQPHDYRAFQLKGRAVLRPAGVEDEARAADYVARTEALLIGLGVPLASIRYWLTARDVAVATMVVDRMFEQTPGPRSGAVVA